MSCVEYPSVSWDGFLFDCDFNQMLDLKINGEKKHISDYNLDDYVNRNVVIGLHCFGCTAGAGSLWWTDGLIIQYSC